MTASGSSSCEGRNPVTDEALRLTNWGNQPGGPRFSIALIVAVLTTTTLIVVVIWR